MQGHVTKDTFVNRLIASIILVGVIFSVLFLSKGVVFFLTVTAIIALALYEFFTMAEAKGIPIYKYFGILIGLLIPLTVFIGFELSSGWELVFVLSLCFVLFGMQLSRKDTAQSLVAISTTLFGILYISWFFSFVLKIRFFEFQGLDGRWLVFFVVMVTKIGDIAAYAFGKTFGTHILIARISPKKTWEGFVAGLVAAIGVGAFLGLLPYYRAIPYLHLVGLTVLLSLVGQFGDLSESLIKRDCQVKDSAHLFPGIGGMLDVVDSLLFTIPVMYFYLKFYLIAR